MDTKSPFSTRVEDYWLSQQGEELSWFESQNFVVYQNSALNKEYPAVLLDRDEKPKQVLSLHPILVQKIKETGQVPITVEEVEKALNFQGFTLYTADCLYYYSQEEQEELKKEIQDRSCRQLTSTDAALFEAFTQANSEDDIDAAYVELSHEVVFACFDGDIMVAIASAYPWEGTKIMDLGVLTHVNHRGKGYAQRLVRTISQYVIQQGGELQYRCQWDNWRSIRLAQACGLRFFGRWRIAIQKE